MSTDIIDQLLERGDPLSNLAATTIAALRGERDALRTSWRLLTGELDEEPEPGALRMKPVEAGEAPTVLSTHDLIENVRGEQVKPKRSAQRRRP